MAEPAQRKRLTYSEYLDSQDGAVKYEFVDGVLYDMAGGTRAHAMVRGGLFGALLLALRGKPCRVASSDARVHIPASGDGLYPDAHVVCGPNRFGPLDKEGVTNPILVAEVLSESTEVYDRTRKFELYESLESLEEYVLLSQGERRVELFRRNDDGAFTRHVFRGDEAVQLASLGVSLPLAEIYALAEADAAAVATESETAEG